MKHIVVFVTASNKSEAEKIVNTLVEKKFIACGNIISPMSSVFMWKGKQCLEDEVLIIMKSTSKRMKDIIFEVRKLHSYETPEIIALPIIDGFSEYLQWIVDETT